MCKTITGGPSSTFSSLTCQDLCMPGLAPCKVAHNHEYNLNFVIEQVYLQMHWNNCQDPGQGQRHHPWLLQKGFQILIVFPFQVTQRIAFEIKFFRLLLCSTQLSPAATLSTASLCRCRWKNPSQEDALFIHFSIHQFIKKSSLMKRLTFSIHQLPVCTDAGGKIFPRRCAIFIHFSIPRCLARSTPLMLTKQMGAKCLSTRY